jgi:hypothetical protein
VKEAQTIEQGKDLLKNVKVMDETIDYINDLHGSFEDPKEALLFLKPCIKRRIFSNIFKRALTDRREN